MSADRNPTAPRGRSNARRWFGAILAVKLAVVAAVGAMAQTTPTTPPPTYCSVAGCYDTLEDAEASLSTAYNYYGADAYVEHVKTVQTSAVTIFMQYWLRDRIANEVKQPAYYGNFGFVGNSNGTCALSDDQAALPDWCANMDQFVSIAESRFATAWPGCTITGSTITQDFDTTMGIISNGTSTRGIADYSLRWYKTTATCSSGTNKSTTWSVAKKRPFYCITGYTPLFITLTEDKLAQGNVCGARNHDVANIITQVRQCATCAGSPHPVYPATGEKQRQEPDFVFAGTTFTRYYRSLRQFRNNRNFAVAWNHTWSDRIITGGTSTEPYTHIDEQGNFEAYKLLGGNRSRSQNSVDRVLERVNANGIGWRLWLPDGETREFDLNGYLIAVHHPEDPLNDVSIAYVDNAISTVTDGQGRVLRFGYYNNLLQTITLPDGSQYLYTYDADKNLTGVLNPDWSMRFYYYNETGLAGAANQKHLLTGIVNEFGQRIASFSYDIRGRVIESRMHGSPEEVTHVSYPNEDAAVVQTASNGSDSYVIQSGVYRRILGLTDSAGSRSYSYATDGRMQSMLDARNVETRYEYTGAYRTATIEAYGTPEQRRTEIDRDAVSGRLLQQRVFDASGTLRAKMVLTYNARNQLATVSRIDPVTLASRTVTYTYCESADVTAGTCPIVGLLTAVDGPRADVQDVVTYTYRMADEATCATAPTICPWRKGDLWKTTNALSQAVEIASRDGAGRPKSIIDATGVTTDLEYNARGWATARKVRGTNGTSESDDRVTRFWYYAFGAIKRVLQADGMDATFTYDAAERLTTIGDNRGNTIQYTLNAAGDRTDENVVDTSGTIRQTVSRTYDTLGRLQSQVDAYNHATTFEYDAEGLPTRTTDALLRMTDTTNDPLGRTTLTVADVGGIAAQTHVQYDALDRVARVTDPKGLDTIYTYNGFDDLVQLESPDTGVATSDYDAAGNRTSATDARQVTVTTQYDVLNRPTNVDYPGTAEDVAYEYDTPTADCAAGETFLTGRLAKMSDSGGSGSTSYCYNRFGDLVRKVQRTNGQALVLQWSVLANGRLASMTYPDGAVVDFVRDSLGRTTGLGVTPLGGTRQTLLSSATYHPFGPVAQWTWGNARTMTRTLNLNGQPGIVQDTAPGGLSLGYQFDEVGNLKWLRDGYQADPPLRVYGYDALNRLTSAEDGATNAVLQAYTYDATGNRTSRTQGALQAYTYGTTDHKLQGVAGIARGYDAMGNTTSIGGTAKEFVYNQAGRMSAVKVGGTQTAGYGYNGRGERVSKVSGGQAVLTLYAQDGRWLGDYDAAGQPLQQVVWFGDLPVGLLTGAGTGQKLHYVEPDALGSPRVVIDPVRNVTVWRWDLAGEAFGDTAPVQDPDGNGTAFVFDMRFPGQRYDSASGINYNYFRDYDPATGRYVESDPIGLEGGISSFGYANGNPLVQFDKLGLDVIGIHTNTTSTGPKSEHAWLGIYDDSGKLLMTIGAWERNHRAVVDKKNACGCDYGVYWNTEIEVKYQPKTSFYFYATKEQVKQVVNFSRKPWTWRLYGNNCSTWVEEAMQMAYPGLDLKTASLDSFFGDSPRTLSLNLEFFREQFPQNSATNPYVTPRKP